MHRRNDGSYQEPKRLAIFDQFVMKRYGPEHRFLSVSLSPHPPSACLYASLRPLTVVRSPEVTEAKGHWCTFLCLSFHRTVHRFTLFSTGTLLFLHHLNLLLIVGHVTIFGLHIAKSRALSDLHLGPDGHHVDTRYSLVLCILPLGESK